MTRYLNKYSCTDCGTSLWAISDPLQCNRCFGIMLEVEHGTTIVPEGFTYVHQGESLFFDWEAFDQWREDIDHA